MDVEMAYRVVEGYMVVLIKTNDMLTKELEQSKAQLESSMATNRHLVQFMCKLQADKVKLAERIEYLEDELENAKWLGDMKDYEL